MSNSDTERLKLLQKAARRVLAGRLTGKRHKDKQHYARTEIPDCSLDDLRDALHGLPLRPSPRRNLVPHNRRR